MLNDSEAHLWNNGINAVELSEDDISCYIKLSVIMYADDTVLIALEELQTALDSLLVYVKTGS